MCNQNNVLDLISVLTKPWNVTPANSDNGQEAWLSFFLALVCGQGISCKSEVIKIDVAASVNFHTHECP